MARHGIAWLTMGTLLASAGGAALADELPRRKPGQWEITTRMSVMGDREIVLQQCIDERTDARLMAQVARQPGDCTPPKITRAGERTTIETLCRMDRSQVTTHGQFSGNFDADYRGEIVSVFDPPLEGIKESRMAIAARWLGPCPPEQKPGSSQLVVPGVGNLKLDDKLHEPGRTPAR